MGIAWYFFVIKWSIIVETISQIYCEMDSSSTNWLFYEVSFEGERGSVFIESKPDSVFSSVYFSYKFTLSK